MFLCSHVTTPSGSEIILEKNCEKCWLNVWMSSGSSSVESLLPVPPNSDMNMKWYVNVGQILPRNLTTRQRCKYTGNGALTWYTKTCESLVYDCECLNKLFRLSSVYLLHVYKQRCPRDATIYNPCSGSQITDS